MHEQGQVAEHAERDSRGYLLVSLAEASHKATDVGEVNLGGMKY